MIVIYNANDIATVSGSATMSSSSLSSDMATPPSTVYVSPATSAMGSPTSPPSWKPVYDLDAPPDVVRPYEPEDALQDISGVHYALEVFLSSHMLESEQYCNDADETKCALPFQLFQIPFTTRQGATLFRDGLRTHTVHQGANVIRRRGQYLLIPSWLS